MSQENNETMTPFSNGTESTVKRLWMKVLNSPPIVWIFLALPFFIYGMTPGTHWTQYVCLFIAGWLVGYKGLG